MPAIRVSVAATTADALNGLKFKVQGRPALVTLYAAGDNAGNLVSLSVGTRELLVNAAGNIQAAAGVIDTDRDQILFRDTAPPGEYFMPVTLAGAVLNALLVIEPL